MQHARDITMRKGTCRGFSDLIVVVRPWPSNFLTWFDSRSHSIGCWLQILLTLLFVGDIVINWNISNIDIVLNGVRPSSITVACGLM